MKNARAAIAAPGIFLLKIHPFGTYASGTFVPQNLLLFKQFFITNI